jgi:uncharacterized protein (DUF885 family)
MSAMTFWFPAACSVIFMAAASGLPQPPKGVARTEASDQLHRLFEERFNWQLEQFPEMAMARGDYSNADRITDHSLAAIENRHQATVEFLRRLAGIDKGALEEDDVVSYELFELELRDSVEGHRFRTFLAPIGGRFGPQQEIPQMAERTRFGDESDYENYLKRLEQTPKWVEDTIEALKAGVAERRTPPRVTLMGVPAQFAALVDGDGLKALADPLEKMPPSLNPDKARWLKERFQTTSLPSIISSMSICRIVARASPRKTGRKVRRFTSFSFGT